MIKLLLIDDDSGIRQAMDMFFKAKPNYQLFLTGTGKDGLQIAERERLDLVVLDMLIPDMEGEKVFKQLKVINPQINVIFLTGMEKETVAEKAKQLGARGFLEKPFDVFTLEDYFKKVVPEIY